MEYKIGQVINFKYYDNIYGKLIAIGNYIKYHEAGYTHSAIIYDVKKDAIVVAEALGSGFTISDYDRKWVDERIKDGTISIGDATQKLTNIQENIKKYEGIPYGWLDIFNCAWYIIFGKLAFKFSNGTKHLICSEAVCRCLYDSSKTIDFEKEFGKPFDTITPSDLSYSKFIKWQK